MSESVAKALRGGIGDEKKRGISTFFFARSGSIRAFATDLDNLRRRGPREGRHGPAGDHDGRPDRPHGRSQSGPGLGGPEPPELRGARGIRTPDLFHAMEARYQLRHSPIYDRRPGRRGLVYELLTAAGKSISRAVPHHHDRPLRTVRTGARRARQHRRSLLPHRRSTARSSTPEAGSCCSAPHNGSCPDHAARTTRRGQAPEDGSSPE